MNGSAVHCLAITLREGAVTPIIPPGITVFSGSCHTVEKLKIDSGTSILSVKILAREAA